MNARYTFLATFSFAAAHCSAQYCSPSFQNGCFGWHNTEILAGTINWTFGTDACDVSDYTSLQTTVNAGDQLDLSVTNGAWCGCAVWVDLDNSVSFEDSENLYYLYGNVAATHTYDFSITIPAATAAGNYRMRIIAPWGSDGFTPGSQNGFGPCGAYQYGNFNDFTVNVIGAMAVDEVHDTNALLISPNPSGGRTFVERLHMGDRVEVTDASGRLMEQGLATSNHMMIDASEWEPGLYVLRAIGSKGMRTQRFVVE
jgi:trimeric autotransporter adhesin